MATIIAFLEAQPLLTLFLAIGTGYALGQVSIFGFSLGAGAVLFTGLFFGAIAPKATPPGMVGTLGLLMFLYGVGIQYGRQFFAGLKGPGLAWNAIGFVGVIASLLVALQLGRCLAYRSRCRSACSLVRAPPPRRCRRRWPPPEAATPQSVTASPIHSASLVRS